MLSSLFFAVAALPSAALAYGHVFRDVAKGASVEVEDVVRYPVTAKTKMPSTFGKRQTTVDIISQNEGTFYTIDLVLGTPGQKVTVVFDTGSAELWVNPNCSNAYDPTLCSKFGRFTGSTTLVDAHVKNEIRYGTGGVELAYVYDYVQLGSAKLKQQVFGVALNSNFTATGIMGAGPMGNTWNSSYPLIIDSLVQQGFIKSRAFSLDLRNMGDNRGSVTFGGLDTKKFSGSLEKRPIIPATNTPDKAIRYWVYMDGMSVSSGNGTTTPVFDKVNGVPVFLDSGGTLSQLPTYVVKELLKSFPSAKKNGKVYTVECPARDSKMTIDFKFGNTTVYAPVNDFIWRSGKYCILGAFENDKDAILGDSFLRAAYVVYDQDNKNIYIANNEDCGSNLIAIGKGPNAVPSVVGECRRGLSLVSSSVSSTTTSSQSSSVSAAPVQSSNFTASGNFTWTSAGKTSTARATTSSIVTSTIRTTRTYTITSCAPTVTNCNIGKVTTEVYTSYTTHCPATTHTSQAMSSAMNTTRTGFPDITATYVLPVKYICHNGPSPCPNETRPPPPVVTVLPVVTQSTTVKL
ncbi:hypothetical protein PLICBS_001760 [Purpureocillium lilacinum]|uniref:uncharacterized protein n=1 Tax=Purpureocillium lilacinum TaxID=33203 RepID=UPI00208CBF96|nr:hypothetical protein PLICBS_001760 [Purpureocillium lilacinum]